MKNARDPREKMAYQLLMRGHATMDELLTASFGEWPPQGLDIIGKNNQRVKLTSLWNDDDDDPAEIMSGLGDEKDKSEPLSNRIGNLIQKTLDMLSVAGLATLDNDRVIKINRLLCCMMPFPLRESLKSVMGHETAHILQGDHYWRAYELFTPADNRELVKEKGIKPII